MTLFASNALQCTVNGVKKTQNCPSPFEFRHPAGGGPSHSHRQHAQKNWQRSRVWFRRYPVGQTDTQTDVLITILRDCFRGRSKTHEIFCTYYLCPCVARSCDGNAIRYTFGFVDDVAFSQNRAHAVCGESYGLRMSVSGRQHRQGRSLSASVPALSMLSPASAD